MKVQKLDSVLTLNELNVLNDLNVKRHKLIQPIFVTQTK